MPLDFRTGRLPRTVNGGGLNPIQQIHGQGGSLRHGKKEDGPFATLFLWIGFIAGGAAGIEANDFMGMLIGAIILGGIGFWV